MGKQKKAIAEVLAHKHILVCGNNLNALSIIRSLGEVGIRPIVIVLESNAIHLVEKSKYVGKVIHVPSFKESFQILLSYKDAQCKPFVYTSDDNHQSLLDMNYEELKDYFYFFNAGEKGRTTYFMDKDKICLAAQKCGFDIANGEVLLRGQMPQNLRYPVITKTLNPCDYGWKRDVGIYYSADELAKAYTEMVSQRLLVEEYIEKKNELSMQGFSIDGGKIVYLPFKRQYFRFTKTSYGSYCYYYTNKDEALTEKITQLIRKIGFSGNFEIEFIEKPDGGLVFLEINFRHALSNYASTIGGVNLPYEWAKATLRHSLEGLVPTRDYFTALFETKDYANFVKTGQISKLKWLKDFFNADSYYLWNRLDMRPVVAFYLGKAKRKLRHQSKEDEI